jgi:TRAP-type C4-dicarboxylate transport system permease small subunit
MVLLGASIGVQKRSHFVVSFIADKFPIRYKKIVNLMIYSLMIIVCFFLLVQGIDYAGMGMSKISPHTQIKMMWIYSAVPISASMMLLYLIIHLKDALKTRKSEDLDQ